MAQTPISGSAAYCTAAQFTTRCDWRTAARLLSDTTTPLASKAAVEADATLATLLMEASGEVEMACARAGRYTAPDLAALAGTNAGEKLARLVADLALWALYDRRPDKKGEMPVRCQAAQDLLARVEHGDRIFPFQETADAGVMDDLDIDATDVINGDGVVIQASRFFGIRANQVRRAP